MKSRSRHHRSKWAHCNTPGALRRRRAAADAKREAICATLPPAYAGPEPLSRWQSVVVLDAHGQVMHRVDLFVPADSSGARCDQHAAMIDGDRALMTATQIGAKVRGWVVKRPSASLLAEIRRDDWRAAAMSNYSSEHTAFASPSASLAPMENSAHLLRT
jgi:hypothetical protein